jgi:hypothetical protein
VKKVDIGAHLRNSDMVNKSRGHVLFDVACNVVAGCMYYKPQHYIISLRHVIIVNNPCCSRISGSATLRLRDVSLRRTKLGPQLASLPGLTDRRQYLHSAR